ncbi:putative nuclease HARBI1 [Saccostrea echinata]|uniref:putative nuclease HARBI1 n=1 Tax=Saccostrea echinata TaxID=191078 RepID=UPI002A7FB729|nr:putative nuclease HARBI1 [Saccostrea echinata]
MAYIIMREILQENDKPLRRERVFRDRSQVLDTMSDYELIERYRFPSNVILTLVDAVKKDIEPKTCRSYAIPAHIQVLTCLRFLAKGDYLSETTDIHGISKASGCLIIHRVINAICKNLNNIQFPSRKEQLTNIKAAFYKIAGFPNVVGAIDGTQIPIQGMTTDDEHLYVCRKGFHSINVQAVVDADLRFTNAVCKFPGSTHDAYILQNSFLPNLMVSLQSGGWITGDSGYPLKEWLMTPIRKPSGGQEERYNSAHCRTRNVIERAFGVLKARFRCLHKTGGCLPYKPDKCTKIIECAIRLHNLAINEKVPLMVETEVGDDGQQPFAPVFPNIVAAAVLRERLVQRF